MSSVKRLFVEKRPGFDVEARHMLADLRENLGIAALEAIRVVNRYDLEGSTRLILIVLPAPFSPSRMWIPCPPRSL